MPKTTWGLTEEGAILFGKSGTARGTPLAQTLDYLGVTAAELLRVDGPILLLGEGYGTLYPLLKNRRDVVAVDPLYGLTPARRALDLRVEHASSVCG